MAEASTAGEGQEPSVPRGPQLDLALTEELEAAGVLERLETDLKDVQAAYGAAMRTAQVFELAAKLLVPSLDAPTDDDEESSAVVRAALKLGLSDAIQAASLRAELEATLSPDWFSEAQDARHRRNQLAHDYWWHAIPELMAGRADLLRAELSQDVEKFERLLESLFETLYESAGRRGLSRDDLQVAATAVTAAQVFRPELLEGLHLLRDGEDVLDRLAAAVREAGQ